MILPIDNFKWKHAKYIIIFAKYKIRHKETKPGISPN